MMTIDKELVKKAMEESGFTPQLVDAVTHKGFYDDIMSQEDPDSKDVYVLYGILNISGKQNKQAVSKPNTATKKPNDKKRSIGCMQQINKKNIVSLYERKGYTATTFAESCGCRTASNLSIMLSRGSCKWNTVLAMSKVLGCVPRDIIIGVCNATNADIVPISFPKELTKNINEFTTEVNGDNFSKKLGSKLSPSKIAKIMRIPVSLVKLAQVPSSKCRLPISAIQYLCDSGEIDLEDILAPTPSKDDIKQVRITDPTPSETENMEEALPKNPFSSSQEEKPKPAQGQKRFETAFEEFLHNSAEAKKHQEYLEGQHKQESIIRSKNQLLEIKKTEMMHNGMISIDALIKITEMLQQNPEVQDLFITLATLPDGKRQHAINALNTLITSLS